MDVFLRCSCSIDIVCCMRLIRLLLVFKKRSMARVDFCGRFGVSWVHMDGWMYEILGIRGPEREDVAASRSGSDMKIVEIRSYETSLGARQAEGVGGTEGIQIIIK